MGVPDNILYFENKLCQAYEEFCICSLEDEQHGDIQIKAMKNTITMCLTDVLEKIEAKYLKRIEENESKHTP